MLKFQLLELTELNIQKRKMNNMKDMRKKRQKVKRDNRKNKYIYTYEVAEAARILGVPEKNLQEHINSNIDDIQAIG